MDIWAKEIKEKMKKNWNSMERAVILSLGQSSRKERQENKNKKGLGPHK